VEELLRLASYPIPTKIIAKKLNISERAVRRAIMTLFDEGVIVKILIKVDKEVYKKKSKFYYWHKEKIFKNASPK